MHVFKHFSTPHRKTSLNPNKPPNNKSTMGFKGRMVDDQIANVKFITTQLQELLGIKVQACKFVPHFYGRISGCHNLLDFT
jgi:hypothetical protein